ncbi:MAG: glycosyltransferase, partial [Mangrovimonas sp.]|nr:glycosyltransferase [Mangrovimonas sp.]
MLKKVLIVAYYWPPAGGPGVQRWLKFVKYLPDFGIEPIVFVPENASYPIVDESLNTEISSAATVIKFPIKEPYKLAGFLSKSSKNISKGIIPDKKKQSLIQQMMLYIRGNFFIPDARIGWVKPSVSFLETYCSEHKIDTLITTGPPHSLHLIGLHLKEKLSLKWITDFRDPWTSIDYHKELKLSKASENKHKALEKQVLTTADQIVVTSESTRLEFEQITSKPIEVITNGYDTVQA